MRDYVLVSHFADTEMTVYHYPALYDSNSAVFILKGLYGAHDPNGSSWDNELVSLLESDHHVFFIRTGRLRSEDREKQFEGKLFAQECADVRSGFTHAVDHLLPKSVVTHCIAMSFGGTVLLGVSRMLNVMKTVVLIGSGCGRSPQTKKPLLSSLPETNELLNSLETFDQTLVFLRGGKDTVVPIESQQKIFSAALSARIRAWIEYPPLDHELSDADGSQLALLSHKHFRDFSLHPKLP